MLKPNQFPHGRTSQSLWEVNVRFELSRDKGIDLGTPLWAVFFVKWSEVKWKLFSSVWLFVIPWTIQSMEFSRPEYRIPRHQTQVSHIAGGFFTSWATRESLSLLKGLLNIKKCRTIYCNHILENTSLASLKWMSVLNFSKAFIPPFNHLLWASLVFRTVKTFPAMRETQVQPLSQEDPLENGMATHSSILA